MLRLNGEWFRVDKTMKSQLIIFLIIVSGLHSFVVANSINGDSTIRVLVLTPYDKIANAGASPDTQTILESALANKDRISIIPFPYRKLMGVPYQMVFHKKYCKAITDKVDCDVIIMTQINTNNEREPGIWPWAYKIRIYNVRTGMQIDSIHGEDLKAKDFSNDITSKINRLVKDIESSFHAP